MTCSAIPLLALAMFSACKPTFTDADIKKCESDIRLQFSTRPGVTVTEVSMVKKSDTELTGFAKLRINLGAENVEAIKNCSATLGEDNRFVWQCI